MPYYHLLNHYTSRTAGVFVYHTAKASAKFVNLNKRMVKINADTQRRIQIFFPLLNLEQVFVVQNAILPANWLEASNQTNGMTFGNTIYSSLADLQYDFDGFLLLIHELVHIKQIIHLGERKFASQYGEEFLQFGYPKMPLEQEAYNFVANMPFNPTYYLRANNDVNIAVKGSYTGALIHWLDVGLEEGRDSNAFFNAHEYLKRHDDLAKKFGRNNFKAGVLHWIQYGKNEGRKGKIDKW